MSEYENVIKNYPLDVNKYLDETKGHFIDQEMIKIVEMKNSYFDAAIVNGMLQACVSYDMHVDEEKLRKLITRRPTVKKRKNDSLVLSRIFSIFPFPFPLEYCAFCTTYKLNI